MEWIPHQTTIERYVYHGIYQAFFWQKINVGPLSRPSSREKSDGVCFAAKKTNICHKPNVRKKAAADKTAHDNCYLYNCN